MGLHTQILFSEKDGGDYKVLSLVVGDYPFTHFILDSLKSPCYTGFMYKSEKQLRLSDSWVLDLYYGQLTAMRDSDKALGIKPTSKLCYTIYLCEQELRLRGLYSIIKI